MLRDSGTGFGYYFNANQKSFSSDPIRRCRVTSKAGMSGLGWGEEGSGEGDPKRLELMEKQKWKNRNSRKR